MLSVCLAMLYYTLISQGLSPSVDCPIEKERKKGRPFLFCLSSLWLLGRAVKIEKKRALCEQSAFPFLSFLQYVLMTESAQTETVAAAAAVVPPRRQQRLSRCLLRRQAGRLLRASSRQ